MSAIFSEYRSTIVVPAKELRQVNRLLRGPATDCGRDETFYEQEVFFEGSGGKRMLVQAIASSEPSEGGWTQGVLFEPDETGLLHEVGCTDVGDTFDGEYTVYHDRVPYTAVIRGLK